ncbi:MAG: rRNA cytosine-C5-methyltransferase [Muribaculaceae bacterium]|nr:rRNA cytosine-C5-methyltransferase [Muribaculaceae bacterium]
MQELTPQGFDHRFIEMLGTLGHEAYIQLPRVIADGNPPVSLRLNPAKVMAHIPQGTPVPWHAGGLYLDTRPAFTFDPSLHQGAYYVQDASSMAHAAAVARAAELIGSTPSPLRYLDACAAPGGKTTAAVDALPHDAFIVANEYDPRRTSVLAENLAKWGAPALVTRSDASAIDGLDGFFDIIAADVPCSGEGMMRKDSHALAQWTPALVSECAARQKAIICNLWRSLRPGGYMIYSTCTFNTVENEQMVRYIAQELGADIMPVPALQHPGILGAAARYDDMPVYRFVPGYTAGEGQFIALLRKHGDEPAAMPRRIRTHDKPLPDYGLLDGRFVYLPFAGRITAIPEDHRLPAAAVAQALHTTECGITAGVVKGRDIIPAQQLAMARNLRRGAFAVCDITDTDIALNYLRHEAITLPHDAPRGHVLLTYGGLPLGFVKNIGNRANNLYPAQWRILSR